jgi:hypothetical protein
VPAPAGSLPPPHRPPEACGANHPNRVRHAFVAAKNANVPHLAVRRYSNSGTALASGKITQIAGFQHALRSFYAGPHRPTQHRLSEGNQMREI